MIYVGLDYSNNFPGLCYTTDFIDYKFISILDTTKLSKVQLNYIKSISEKSNNYLKLIELNSLSNTASSIYHENERSKLINNYNISKNIIDSIFNLDKQEITISMEGLAYSAKGSSLPDIAMGTGIIRHSIYKDLLNFNEQNFYVFTPSEIKKAMNCKGNANKLDVFNAFISSDLKNPIHTILNELKENPYIINKGKVQHPWEDIIDAYGCLLKLKTVII